VQGARDDVGVKLSAEAAASLAAAEKKDGSDSVLAEESAESPLKVSKTAQIAESPLKVGKTNNYCITSQIDNYCMRIIV
jgi:hypothetical protein